MNVYEHLRTALEKRENEVLDGKVKFLYRRGEFGIEEKKRLLYIEMCKLFSYDYRIGYLPYLGKRKELGALLDEQIDLENTSCFTVNCHSFSRACQKALTDLLGFKSEISGWGGSRICFI